MCADPARLHTFLAPLTSQWTSVVDWPLARFVTTGYLCDQLPPEELITSVRAVVLRTNSGDATEVLVIEDPDGYHITPGGRREAGETLVETAKRELLEESGWQVAVNGLLGFVHFERLTSAPAPAANSPAKFVQLIYGATAEQYCEDAREIEGYELDAAFVAIEQLHRYRLTAGEHLLLAAALAQARQQ